MTLTLVSGGQTGVDRGAFETALRLGLDFGGWAPKGFRAEDGRIPEVYARRMRESADEGYALRTRLNVQDSDATLILSWSSSPEKAGGGTWFTEKTCRQQGKQCVHLRLPRAGEEHPPEVQDGVLKWLRLWKVGVLNVAGPRESKCLGIQAATIACLRWLLEPLAVQQVRQLASEISMIDRALAAQPHPAVANVGLVVDPPESTPPLQPGEFLITREQHRQLMVDIITGKKQIEHEVLEASSTDPDAFTMALDGPPERPHPFVPGRFRHGDRGGQSPSETCDVCGTDPRNALHRTPAGPPEGLDDLQRAQLDASIREAERDICGPGDMARHRARDEDDHKPPAPGDPTT